MLPFRFVSHYIFLLCGVASILPTSNDNLIAAKQQQARLQAMTSLSVQKIDPRLITAAEEAEYLRYPNGPDGNEIARQAQQGLPLTLPWGRKPIRLGTSFHSRLQSTQNPWSDETPFALSDMYTIPKELHAEYGTTSTFKKIETTKESETGDHLSLGLGIGVGLPFVASVNVKGTYDQNVKENKDVSQGARTKSIYLGYV